MYELIILFAVLIVAHKQSCLDDLSRLRKEDRQNFEKRIARLSEMLDLKEQQMEEYIERQIRKNDAIFQNHG